MVTQTLLDMEKQLAELREKYEAEKGRVRTEAIEGIKLMLGSGTLTQDDLRALLPKANPNRRKPGPKPKAVTQEAA